MNARWPMLSAPAALAGGLLWILYAILLLVRPAPLGLTVLAGAGALAALAAALLAAVGLLHLPVLGSGRFGVAMAWVTLLAAAAALVGGALQSNALAGSAMTAGEVLLAFGVLLLAIEAAGLPESAASASTLFLIGVIGMLGLMAQALVAVTTWMLPIYAALVMAVYGLTWVRLGSRLWSAGR